MQLTRRKLARAVLGSAAAQAVAQTPASAPPTPDEDLRAARDRMKANSDALAGQAVPMAAEPAFQFRA